MTQLSGKFQDRVAGSAHWQASIHDDWAAFITRNLCKFSFRTRRETNFQVDASVRFGGGFMLGRFKTIAGNAQLDRGRNEIRSDGEDAYALYMPFRGEHEILQFGRCERCGPGSLTFVSMAEPLLQTKLGDNDTGYMFLPRTFVDQRLIGADKKCARTLSAGTGLRRLLRDSMAAFQETAPGMTDEEFQSSARVVGDLALLAIGGCTDETSDLRSVRAGNLARVKRSIREHLADPDLSPTDLAAKCGVSVRYLHDLFRHEVYTVGEYLKRERLQRAHRLLLVSDPSTTSITEVALACGFANPSQFSTAFRRAFSLSPKDVLHRR